MSEKEKALYAASFLYTDAILKDFEALHLEKKKLPPAIRIILGLLGFAGVVFFGIMLYREGLRIAYVGYMLICSVLLVLAFSRGKSRPDDTVDKYRKSYLNRRVSFHFDETGVEMKLDGQKSYARSKYKEIYALNETERCLYLIIKGRAHYIVSKEALGGELEELKKYLQKKSGKKFIQYDIDPKGAST